jgi:hypothetical protein
MAILAYQEGMIAYLKEAVGDRTKRQKIIFAGVLNI